MPISFLSLSELDTFPPLLPCLPTPKVTAADGRVGRVPQAMPAQAVNKLGAQKCDGKALPPGVHRPSRTFMSHYSHTAVYALINQRSFVEMGWALMNLSVGIFPFTGANNGAKPPHLATL